MLIPDWFQLFNVTIFSFVLQFLNVPQNLLLSHKYVQRTFTKFLRASTEHLENAVKPSDDIKITS